MYSLTAPYKVILEVASEAVEPVVIEVVIVIRVVLKVVFVTAGAAILGQASNKISYDSDPMIQTVLAERLTANFSLSPSFFFLNPCGSPLDDVYLCLPGARISIKKQELTTNSLSTESTDNLTVPQAQFYMQMVVHGE